MEVRRVREAVRRPVEPAVPRAESGLHQEDQVIRHLCSIALVGIEVFLSLIYVMSSAEKFSETHLLK